MKLFCIRLTDRFNVLFKGSTHVWAGVQYSLNDRNFYIMDEVFMFFLGYFRLLNKYIYGVSWERLFLLVNIKYLRWNIFKFELFKFEWLWYFLMGDFFGFRLFWDLS